MGKSKIKMFYKLIIKIFKERRSDVSLYIFSKILCLFIIGKVLSKFRKLKLKQNSCLILFPPSLGLGDLIILSRIEDIVLESNMFKTVGVAYLAPYLQKRNKDVIYIDLLKVNDIYTFQEFILPSPSLFNIFLSFIIGKNKCKGYIKDEIVNFKDISNYVIKFDDPYFYRLKPFKYFFKYKKSIKPKVWSNKDRKDLKKLNKFHSIQKYKRNKLINQKEIFIVLSTYNFYTKFRPSFSSIINEINKLMEKNKNFNLILLGAKASREEKYNFELKKRIAKSFKNIEIINLTGKLSIHNSLEIISQSDFYIGANNGLANVAQMLGVECILIFSGPEKNKKRKFSKLARFISN